MVGAADRFDHVVALIDITFHGVHAAFAVVLRTHCHAFSHELFSQFDIVDHIAVMRANHVAIRVEMGLGIGVGWCSECGPAQLQDGAVAGHFFELESVRYILNFAHIFAKIDFALLGDRCCSDSVITPI